ncbi:MAG: FHA domain-containing protein [Kiritimatiellae bacterium]|nr:FHA domain-containing protein [Kiritimatiellia bacterium]
MATLAGMSEEVKGLHLEIDQEVTTIGRNEENTITVDSVTISGTHCSIRCEEKKYMLRDENSTNGTSLNSRKVSETYLKPKDIIQVGAVEFFFDAEASEIEVMDTKICSDTQIVEIAKGPAAAPESFNTISPFGSQKKDTKRFWFIIISIIGLLALLVVVLFFVKLVTTS